MHLPKLKIDGNPLAENYPELEVSPGNGNDQINPLPLMQGVYPNLSPPKLALNLAGKV